MILNPGTALAGASAMGSGIVGAADGGVRISQGEGFAGASEIAFSLIDIGGGYKVFKNTVKGEIILDKIKEEAIAVHNNNRGSINLGPVDDLFTGKVDDVVDTALDANKSGEAAQNALKGGNSSTVISQEMQNKILEGQRVSPTKNDIIGGHSSTINNDNPLFAVEVLSENADGTKTIKYVKDFQDGNISKIKKSTIFPETWSEFDIIEAVKITGDSPVLATRARDGATFHRQIINGVEIDVIKIGNNVTSGYPTGKVGAPYLSGF